MGVCGGRSAEGACSRVSRSDNVMVVWERVVE